MSTRKTVYTVQFLLPGAIVAETTSRDYDNEPPNLSSIYWPEGSYALRLFRRTDVIDRGETFTGKSEQVGPTYYHPDSTIESLDAVRRNPDAGSILVRNMEANGWDRIVWSRYGNWPQPYDPEKDHILVKVGGES